MARPVVFLRPLACAGVLAILLAFPTGSQGRTPWVHELADLDVAAPIYRPLLGPAPLGRSEYRFTWSGMPVARAAVEVREIGDVSGRALTVQVSGATSPAVDLLWRYRFDARSLVRVAPFGPGSFEADVCENRRLARTVIEYPEHGDRIRAFRQAKGLLKEITFRSTNTFDVAASLLLVLNLDYVPGAHFEIDTFTGTNRYRVAVDVEALEALTRDGRRQDAWRLRVLARDLDEGTDAQRESGRATHVWVGAERPRRLLRARTHTRVGLITAELVKGGEPLPAVRRDGDRCS